MEENETVQLTTFERRKNGEREIDVEIVNILVSFLSLGFFFYSINFLPLIDNRTQLFIVVNENKRER